MAQNKTQQTQQKPSPSNTKNGEIPPALQKAHEVRKQKAAEREKLSDTERARADAKEATRKAAQRLSLGRGNIASTLERHRKYLTEAERRKVVEYLEAQMAAVREAAFGTKSEETQFAL